MPIHPGSPAKPWHSTVQRLRQGARHPIKALRAIIRHATPPLLRGQYTALSFRPLILIVKDYAINHPRAGVLQLLHRLRRHRPHIYYWSSWHVHPGLVDHHLENLRWIEHACPGVRVTVVGQTAAETALFAARGVDTVYCNQNALADERIYRPLPGIMREFDAVYDATLARYKRHALARDLSSLALIGYRNHQTDDAGYANAVLREMSGARWLNDPNARPDAWRFTDGDVNHAYNRCRVGLCLSEIEGAMWVSIQYLLAGLPVVSTPSEGGRDEFFEPPHVRIVDPSPEAVAEGVAQMVRADLPATVIRERTLALMAQHRRRFLAHVQDVFDRAGAPRRFADEWRDVVPHRLVDMTLVGPRRRRAIREHDRRILAGAERGTLEFPPAPA